MVSISPHHHHIATPIAHSPALFSERLGRRTMGLGRTMVIKGEGSRSSFLPAWAGVGGLLVHAPHRQVAVIFTPLPPALSFGAPTTLGSLPPSPVCLLPPSHPPLSLPPHPLPRVHGGKRPLVASSPLLSHLTPSSWMSQAPGQGVARSRPTLRDPMNCSLPGCSVPGILQARVLEWVAVPFSRGLFPTQGLNPGVLHWRQILYCLSMPGQGSP